MERCPVCRARFTDPVCRRCGTDFSKPQGVAAEAAERAREALSLCRQGYFDTAMSLLQKSLLLKREPQLERLLDTLIHLQLQQSVGYLAQGNVAAAADVCRRVMNIKPVPLARALRGFIAQEFA